MEVVELVGWSGSGSMVGSASEAGCAADDPLITSPALAGRNAIMRSTSISKADLASEAMGKSR